jgi:hypothetical protein
MTPADKRILEQIDRWLASVDQHLKYVGLNDADYRRAQAWPPHDRPTRWILEIARQKVDSRTTMGDSRFSESLELMAFVANLVGLQNMQRFIPLAGPPGTETLAIPPTAQTSSQSTLQTIIQPTPPRPQPKPVADEPTREMPKLRTPTPSAPAVKAAAPPAAVATRAVAPPPRAPAPMTRPKPLATPMMDEEFDAPILIPQPRKETKKVAPAKPPTAEKAAESRSASTTHTPQALVVADAIRLLKWGKEWHELTELISRIANRPSAAEIRKILRTQRQHIETEAEKAG